MKIYPIMLKLEGRRAVVVGGGAVGMRKVATLIDAGAEVTLVTPDGADDVPESTTVLRQEYDATTLAGAYLVFACTDDMALNSRVSADARAVGALVNAVDQPDDCDFYVPAIASDGAGHATSDAVTVRKLCDVGEVCNRSGDGVCNAAAEGSALPCRCDPDCSTDETPCQEDDYCDMWCPFPTDPDCPEHPFTSYCTNSGDAALLDNPSFVDAVDRAIPLLSVECVYAGCLTDISFCECPVDVADEDCGIDDCVRSRLENYSAGDLDAYTAASSLSASGKAAAESAILTVQSSALSEDCTGCFASTTACIAAEGCILDCLANSEGCACKTCQCEEGCVDAFMACSGLDPYIDNCPTPTPPDDCEADD